MNTTTHTLVQKLWNYCSVLRDDGMSYGDYVEQLTYLLFLKMADERTLTASPLRTRPASCSPTMRSPRCWCTTAMTC
jgi:type I restriction-modification system DNA methylase subunit